MRSFAASLGLLTALWIGPAAAHGCHHGWQQNTTEGWHSHGLKCDARKGMSMMTEAELNVIVANDNTPEGGAPVDLDAPTAPPIAA